MKMSSLTFALSLLLCCVAVEGLGGCAARSWYSTPPMLRDPQTGQVVNCDTPAARQTIGVTWQMSQDCVRGARAAGMECVTEKCRMMQ